MRQHNPYDRLLARGNGWRSRTRNYRQSVFPKTRRRAYGKGFLQHPRLCRCGLYAAPSGSERLRCAVLPHQRRRQPFAASNFMAETVARSAIGASPRSAAVASREWHLTDVLTTRLLRLTPCGGYDRRDHSLGSQPRGVSFLPCQRS